jgi:regulator of protease activity HflC (stomatin/prohibitin superfamily)
MKFNWKQFTALALMGVSLAACSTVPAGNVGVKVYLLGGNKGVDSEELGVGRYWIGWNEELYIFPTFMQNYCWTKGDDAACGSSNDESLSFQTMDGMTANADVGISYSIDPDKVTKIFQTYRRGVQEITDTFLRNMVRDALVKNASTKPIEYVYGAGKAELIASVQKDVQDQVGPIGIKIDKIYWIGEIRLPETVIASINAKNAATQMAQQRQNEVAQATAEAQKKVAEAKGEADSTLLKAKAQAEANRELAASITPELVQYRALEKWDGVLPRMTGSNAIPFINADPPKGQ